MKNFSRMSAVFFFTLLVSIILSANGAITLKKCVSGRYPAEVKISSCSKSPCELKINTVATIEVRFKAPYEVRYIETKGVLMDSQYRLYPFSINKKYLKKIDKLFEKGEKYSTIKLPLTEEMEYEFKDSFPVGTIFPLGDFELHWALEDDDIDQDFVCFKTIIKVVN
ncbi:uncharacterized protein LOC142325237 [Lycorma delicatula]|uniref:uncharacterized protein LOC142325237 n=1 Tax=Lycorma delicatula TaxID=130591 RepID=UPI003F515D7B